MDAENSNSVELVQASFIKNPGAVAEEECKLGGFREADISNDGDPILDFDIHCTQHQQQLPVILFLLRPLANTLNSTMARTMNYFQMSTK